MGVLAWQPAGADKMFRVAANMNETYYGSEEVQQRKSNLEAPRVTVNNHRMTNVQLPGGQVVQGIRRNNDLGYENQPSEAPALHSRPQVRPRPGGDEAREVDEAPGSAGRRPVEEEADPASSDLRGLLR